MYWLSANVRCRPWIIPVISPSAVTRTRSWEGSQSVKPQYDNKVTSDYEDHIRNFLPITVNESILQAYQHLLEKNCDLCQILSIITIAL